MAATLAAGAAAGETTLVRELAKNRIRVIFIVSGPQGEECAKAFRNVILQSRDNSHKPEDLPIVTVGPDAEKAAELQRKEKGVSILWFIARGECKSELPPSLAAQLPVSWVGMASGAGVLVLKNTSAQNKGATTYIGEVVAPDSDRMAPLAQRLEACSGSDYHNLSLNLIYTTSRIAVFSSPDDRRWAEAWGSAAVAAPASGPSAQALRDYLRAHPVRDMSSGELSKFRDLAEAARAERGAPPTTSAWSSSDWYSLDERAQVPPEKLAERTEVYFLDRTRRSAVVPAPAAAVLTDKPAKETSVVIAHGDQADGRFIVVLSAPNPVVLRAKAARYPTPATLAAGPANEEVKDLRQVRSTTLIVWAENMTSGQREQVRGLLAQDIRGELKLKVEERGDVLSLLEREVATQDMLGATDTARKLRNLQGVRYIWVYRVNSARGSTSYRTNEECVSEKTPPRFAESQPSIEDDKYTEGCVGGGRKDAQRRHRSEFDYDHMQWEARKRSYDREMQASFPTSWRRELHCDRSASVGGQLQLVDLRSAQGAGEVIWEKECSGTDSGSELAQSDQTSVRGVGARPESLPAPQQQDTCPQEMILSAARKAGNGALAVLAETAWMADGSAPDPEETTAPHEAPTPEAPTATEAVASHSDEAAKPLAPQASAPTKAAGQSVQVADVVNGVVYLALTEKSGVRVGDRAQVIVKTKQITAPSGAIIKTIVEEAVLLKVVKVEALSADCAPLTAVDAGKLAQLTKGMAAKTWHPAVAPVPTGGGQTHRRKGGSR